MKKRLLVYLSIALSMILTMFQYGATASMAKEYDYKASEGVSENTSPDIETRISKLSRGSVYLDLSLETFKTIGYETGDVALVKIGENQLFLVPFVEGHVSLGFHKIVLAGSSRDDSLALRMIEGNFAENYGITEDFINQKVEIELYEKAGYLDEINKWDIGRMSSERTDFPDLTDEEFANHRMVTTTGMKKGVLYRTSSPINPMIKRSAIADAANKRAGVTTIINLSESPESAASREGYADSYYATVNHIEVNMNTNFGEEDFNTRLAQGLRFMIEHPGVYEVNCIFGKDRTGFMIAVLECLAGATYDEVIDDYALTYSHYYPDYNNYTPIEERNVTIAEGNLIAQMEYAYGVTDLKNKDLKQATTDYLLNIGMTSEEIEQLTDYLVNGAPEPDVKPDDKSGKDDSAKTANPLKVKGKTVKVKYSKLKKKSQVIKTTKAFKFVNKGQGKLSYKKVKVLKGKKKASAKIARKFVINKKTGKITVKKGVKKGTYKLKVKVVSAGNDKYLSGTKIATITIKVR